MKDNLFLGLGLLSVLVFLVVMTCLSTFTITIDCYTSEQTHGKIESVSNIKATVSPMWGNTYKAISLGGVFWYREDTMKKLRWSATNELRTALKETLVSRVFKSDTADYSCSLNAS